MTDDVILGYGSAMGYSDHVAIEVWHGSGTSERTDVWALGMTAYRLLHGEAWYSRLPSPQALVPAGRFAQRLPWLPHLPDPWRRFVRRCMHDDPGSRYQSARECLNALAVLPTEPAWAAAVGAASIDWSRRSNDRLQRVNWTAHSPRRHSWSAWSESVGGGHRHTIRKEVWISSAAGVQRELAEFLAGSK